MNEQGELWNKVIQIKESSNKIVEAKTILDKIPGSSFSNGGIIKFGPDSETLHRYRCQCLIFRMNHKI